MPEHLRPYLFYDVAVSICSTCFRKIEAKIVFQDGKVLMLKHCPEHGHERVLIADDVEYYRRCREVFLKTSQMPKFLAGQFGAEITTLLGSGAEVIHSSMWGGDLEGLVLQGAPRGLFEKHKVILSAGEPAINRLGPRIPDGTILGARGPFGPFAPDTELARWLKTSYQDRYQVPPNYASFKMAQASMSSGARAPCWRPR